VKREERYVKGDGGQESLAKKPCDGVGGGRGKKNVGPVRWRLVGGRKSDVVGKGVQRVNKATGKSRVGSGCGVGGVLRWGWGWRRGMKGEGWAQLNEGSRLFCVWGLGT